MIQIDGIAWRPDEDQNEAIVRALSKYHIPKQTSWQLHRLSLDARRGHELHYVASVRLAVPHESRFASRHGDRHLHVVKSHHYIVPTAGDKPLHHRPVIIGAGPAGLFAAKLLTDKGYAPIVLERGKDVDTRTRDVEAFWQSGKLDKNSNVQFGEGGAGTFSDGKLNTRVKDKDGRIRKVLGTFVEAGADPSILYWNKPHIGTDNLKSVVKNLRRAIVCAGGEVRFNTCVTDFIVKDDRLVGLQTTNGDGRVETLLTDVVILAIGHSARDTFEKLNALQVPMTVKPFAVGLRIEHPQVLIDDVQYGADVRVAYNLPAADYRLTAKTASGRGVYSFCMCPGGQVVNAASEAERIAVNGMSNAKRDGRNANAALVVTVGAKDFAGDDVMAGVRFQRQLEERAYHAGDGCVPVQRLDDFVAGRRSQKAGDVVPDICGKWQFANLRDVLPTPLSGAIVEAMPVFGGRIHGFDRPDAVFSGVESRTSSPVRILRDDACESTLKGLYPCGEGAGYAGGITSAAADGLRVAETIIRRYAPMN